MLVPISSHSISDKAASVKDSSILSGIDLEHLDELELLSEAIEEPSIVDVPESVISQSSAPVKVLPSVSSEWTLGKQEMMQKKAVPTLETVVEIRDTDEKFTNSLFVVEQVK